MEGKRTREQVVNITITIEKCRYQNMPLYMYLIDKANADSDWFKIERGLISKMRERVAGPAQTGQISQQVRNPSA